MTIFEMSMYRKISKEMLEQKIAEEKVKYIKTDMIYKGSAINTLKQTVDEYFELDMGFAFKEAYELFNGEKYEISLETIEKHAQDIVEMYMYNKYECDKVTYIPAERFEEYIIKGQAFVDDLKENLAMYLIMNNMEIYSLDENIWRIHKQLEETQKKYDSLSYVEKVLVNISNAKIPPTIKEAVPLLLIVLFLEGFFFLRGWLWFMTICIFLGWWKGEVNKFNKRK